MDDSTLSRVRHRQQEAMRLFSDTELTKLSAWVAYYCEDVLVLIEEVERLKKLVQVLETTVKEKDKAIEDKDATIKEQEEELVRLRAELESAKSVRRTALVELHDPLAGMVKK